MKRKSIVTLLSKMLVLVLVCGVFSTLFFITSCKKHETVDLELPEAITAADVNIDTSKIKLDSDVEFFITVPQGEELDALTINGVDLTSIVKNNKFTLKVRKDLDIKVTFKPIAPIKYDVTLGSGLASDDTLTSLDANSVVNIEIVTPENQEIAEFKVDGNAIDLKGALTYTLTVTKNHNVTVAFREIPQKTYTVIWKNWDGTTLKKHENVPYGATPTYDGNIPTKPATAEHTYTFNNTWSPAIKAVDGNQEYIAQFSHKVNKYTITWKNFNGDILRKDENIPYGATPQYNGQNPIKPATAEHTYTFNNTWSPAIKAVNGNQEYVAQFNYEVNKYTITWKNWDGSTLKKHENIPYGETPAYDGNTPTKPKSVEYTYTFSNAWSPAIKAVEGNQEYIAQFNQTENKYNVTLLSDALSSNSNLTNLLGYSNIKIDIEVPAGKEVLEFRVDGSLVDLNGETSYTLTVTNNHNVSILFKNIMYTLTYTIDDGLGNDVFTFQENYTYNNPDDLVTTGYILAETGITDWTYNGAPFTFDGTYDYLQDITLRKTVAPLNSDKLACDLNYDQMTATITEIDNPADQTVIILPNIYLYGTVEYTIVGFKDFSYLDHLFTNQKKVMLLKMPNTITKIGNFTFAGESKLRHISLSNTLQTIGDDAFYDATGLVEINIPNTVETIGDDAFNGTTSLQTVTFENNSRLLSIGYYAFGYSGITSFKLVNDIDIVDKWIFDYANNLETIEIETDSNKYSLLDGVLFSQNGQTLILYPNGKTNTSYEIPNDTVTIADSAFYANTHLKEITFGNEPSLTTIEGYAFCYSIISKFTIPSTVVTINERAFFNTQLEYIIIPSGVTNIGMGAFEISGTIYVEHTSAPNTWEEGWNGWATVYYKPNWTTDNDGVPYVITVNVTKPSTITCVEGSLEGQKLTAGTQVEFQTTVPEGQEVDAVVINGNYTYPTVSNNKFTITVPAVDFTLAVTFKNIIYTLSYVIDDGEHDVFTFQQNYIHNDPTPITDTYIVDETGVSDWTYNGEPFTFGGTYNYLQNITLKKTVAPLTSNDDFDCTVTNDEATITKIKNTADQTVIIIPNTFTNLDGTYPIVGFRDFANWETENIFTNSNIVMLLKMPNTTTRTGNRTFKNETKLKHVSLSSSLETIGDEVFRNTNLAEINIPSTVTTIGDEAFRNTNLAEINIPKAVTTIKGGAFYQTTHLTTVTFEQGSLLSSIGGDAFAYSGITSFKLINDVDIVDKAVFYGASNLATIEIEENSELYLMENGVLFTKDKKTLIIYLNSKTDETYEIPNSVVTIDPLAFYGHTHLKEVNFGSTPSLTTIKGNAFKESSLQKISLPTTVTRIDPGVFHSTFLEYIIVPSGVTTMGAEPFNVEGISVYVDLPSAGSWWHPIWDEGATVYYKPNWTTDGNGVPYVITVNVTKDPEITCVNEDLEGQQLTAGTQVEFEIAATGQEIKELTLNIDGVVSSPTVLNNKFTITIPTVDFSLNVTLEYIPYTLTYSINDGQFIITQNVHYGQEIAKTFIDNEAGELPWSLNGNPVQFPYTFSHTENKTFTTTVAPLDSQYIEAVGDFIITKINNPANVKVVIIPAGYSCTANLTSESNLFLNSVHYVAFPNNGSFNQIGGYTFNNQDVRKVILPNGGDLNIIGAYAFNECKYLTNITIPTAVAILEGAFKGTTSLEEVIFAEGSSLTQIGNYAFANSGITKFKLKNNVDVVGKNAFYGTENLTEFEIEPGSEVYFVDEAKALYTYDKTKLIAYPGARTNQSYNMCSETQIIDVGAFMGNKYLQTIGIGSNFTTISDDAFNSAANFSGIIYQGGANLTTFGKRAFKNTRLNMTGIHPKIRTISEETFSNISNMQYIVIPFPSNIETMEANAFYSEESTLRIYVNSTEPNIDWAEGWDNGVLGIHYNPNWEYQEGIPCYKTVSVTLPDTIALTDTNLSIDELMAGSQVEFKITPPPGEEVETVTMTVEGENSYPLVSNDKFTINVPAVDFTLSVTFKYIPYYITYSINGGLFTITEEVHYGKSVAKTFINSETGNLAWSLDGEELPFPYTYNHTENKIFTTTVDPLAQSTITATIGGDVGNQFATITRINVPSGIKVVIIPTHYNGYPIKVIGDGSEEITWQGIHYIFLPDTVIEIADMAFNMQNIKQIKLSNYLTTIGNYAFSDCDNLKTVTIPNTVTEIGAEAFAHTYSLTDVIFQDGSQLQTIGERAFAGSKITKFKLANNVDIVGKDIFYSCDSLIEFEIEPNSTKYSLDNGVLYSADEKTLIAYPVGKKDVSYAVKAGTEIIGTQAFTFNGHLVEIYIPASVTTIDDFTFFNTYSLENVFFVDSPSLTSIGINAFAYTNLTSFSILNTITTIGDSAFRSLRSNLLSYMVIPSSVETLGNNVFSKDSNRITIYVELESQPAEGWDANWANRTADVHYLPNWEYNGETGIPHYKTVNVALPDTITLVDNNLDNTQLIAGKDVEFNIAIPTGKRIKTLTVNGNGITVVDNKFTIKIVPPTTTLFLEYEYIPYTLTYSINSGLFTITEEVHYGQEVAKTFINEETGNLTWHLDGEEVFFPYPYNHTENKTFTTTVAPIDQSHITATISGEESNEFATITGIDNFYSLIKVVIIPEYYSTYPVKVIGDGSNALCNYEARYVALPNTVIEIARRAFYHQCTSQIKLSNNLTTIRANAFQGCTMLKTITIPNTVTTIGFDAFAGTSALKEVIFQDGSQLLTIEEYAFYKSGITKFKVANDVDIGGKNIFNSCQNLIEFEIEPNSTVYSIDDGVLYSANGKTLIAYPAGKKDASYTIKANTEVIVNSAFCTNHHLNEVYIPATVTTISVAAFYDASCLESVVIENGTNLITIGMSAFGETNITAFNIPNTVKTIEHHAFRNLRSNLSYMVIPNSVTTLGCDIFYKDSNRITIYVELESQPAEGWHTNWANGTADVHYLPNWAKNENGVPYAKTVTVTKDPAIITCVEESLEGQPLTAGKQVEFQATAPEGKEVDAVIINGNYTYPTVSNNKFTITVPAVNFTLDVTFKYIIYTLSYIIDDGLEHDVFTFQETYTYNNPDDLVTTDYILAETGITDWTYNGDAFTFGGTYNYLQNITLRKTVAPLDSGLITCNTDNELGTATITQINNPADQTVIILPDTYFDGTSTYTIVGFKDFNHDEKLFIRPNTVMLLKMPDTITSVGTYAFQNESKLRHVVLSNSLTNIKNTAFIRTGLVEVNIPNSVISIGDFAFGSTHSLQTVTFEDNSGLATIGYEAFANSGITSFKLVNDVNIIGKRVFAGTNNLTTIEIVEASNNYSLVDGVLFSKDGQTLICYPGGKTNTTYEIPNSVVTIDSSAFYKNTHLNEITFGSNPSLKTIGLGAFYNSSISKFTIPSTVTTINSLAFQNTQLTYIIIPSEVNYVGDMAFMGSNLNIFMDREEPPTSWGMDWHGWNNVYYRPDWVIGDDGVPVPYVP